MKTFPELLEEANAEIKSVSAEEVKQQLDNEEIILVDVRSKDVIEAEGQIEGSIHVPRDMLEFHADQRPDNPLRKEELNPEKKLSFIVVWVVKELCLLRLFKIWVIVMCLISQVERKLGLKQDLI